MNTAKKITAALAVAACLGTVGFATPQPVKAQVPPPAPPVTRPMRGERHPEIRRALTNLQKSKSDLQHAAHDFGGHREQALDLVQRAIDQCQQALRDDKH